MNADSNMTAGTSENKPSSFSADRPIVSKSQDLLGRCAFAESLASAIHAWKGKDSLVIALFGPWGSGKTSLKNMTLECLREGGVDAPQILEFDPWQWAGQDEIGEGFFQQLGIAIGRTDQSKQGKRRAQKWRLYASYLKLGSSLAGGFRRALILSTVLVALLGASTFLQFDGTVRIIGLVIGVSSAIVATVLGLSANIANRIAEVFQAKSEVPGKTLSEYKGELRDALATGSRSVLVVLDDIDRLSTAQTRLVFQLIKANADFPNLVYLLLFQRDLVERKLDENHNVKGRDFLEKIVQVGFDIPIIERSRLERVLFAGLDSILGDRKVAVRFDQQRWGNIFLGGLRNYFQTLRDVHRYLGTLSFHVGLLSSESFEVNPIDLIVIEALRLFEPNLHHRLLGLKPQLTGSLPTLALSDSGVQDFKKTMESLLLEVQEEKRPYVREILKQIFPPAEWAFGGTRYSSEFREGWLRDLRVCDPNIFDRYFYFAVPEGDISQTDLDRLLSLTGSREAFASRLRTILEHGLLGVTLDRLEAYKEKLDLSDALPIVTAIFDIGDELPESAPGSFEIGADMRAVRIIYWYLIREKDEAKRVATLVQAMRSSSGVFLPVMYTSVEDDKQGKEKDPEAFVVKGDDLQELRAICAQKIKGIAESGRLTKHARMAYILYRWREWRPSNEAREWVEKLIESQEGALSFVSGFLQRSGSQGYSDYAPRIHWRINLKSLEDFVSVESLEKKIGDLKPDPLDEKGKKALATFRRAMERRRLGKVEDDWWHDVSND